jgi:hypothetical protein
VGVELNLGKRDISVSMTGGGCSLLRPVSLVKSWRMGRVTRSYVAPIRDTDTPILIRRYIDTAFSKNKDTSIRQVYIILYNNYYQYA